MVVCNQLSSLMYSLIVLMVMMMKNSLISGKAGYCPGRPSMELVQRFGHLLKSVKSWILPINKIYPKLLPTGYARLEFTNGLNTLPVNAYCRWINGIASLTLYVGDGIGLATPYVEVVRNEENSEIF